MTMMQAATARTSERNAFYDRNGGFNKAALWDQLHGSVTARPGSSDRKFRRYLKTLGLITMVGVSANLAMPMGKAQAGGFGLTCNNVKLDAVDDSKKAILSADCKRKDPTKTLYSSINLNDYLANSGGLVWATHGDFQQTCNNDRLHVVNLLGLHLGTLAANCLGVGPFGLPGDSVIELNEHITNDDGTLKYSP